MKPTLSQRLIALLCLLAFGLGQTLFASMAVRCKDASGESRIELGCSRTATGICVAACDPDHMGYANDGSPVDPGQPCNDEPLKESTEVAKSLAPKSNFDIQTAFVVAVLVYSDDLLALVEPTYYPHRWSDRDRPPDAISRLRTVILVV